MEFFMRTVKFAALIFGPIFLKNDCMVKVVCNGKKY
jgi:hypothetical protein